MQQAAHIPGGKTVTIVLSGAATRGGFEAGALRIVAERKITVVRIVAVSSGALNGAAYAAGVRSRQERKAAEQMVATWQDQGGWRDLFHISLRGIVRRDGLLDHTKLRALLRRRIQPSTITDPAPIELQIVVTSLQGGPGYIGKERATTYTKVLTFEGESFDSQSGLEQVFTAAVASASYPFIFTPTIVPGAGPCVDGGLVNGTPIRHAFRGELGSSVDAVLVITATPVDTPDAHAVFHGRRLFTRMTDILFSEWLYRDLRDAMARNATLSRLDELARRWHWSPEELSTIKDALAFENKRIIPLVSIRPLAPLPGDSFSGFFSASDRRRYIEAGMGRASAVLDQLGWG